MVVLTVRQTAQFRIRSLRPDGVVLLLPVVQCGRQFSGGEMGEALDPGLQFGLFGRAGLDALAAPVGHAGGRLSEQQGSIGVVAIDQGDQRLAERLDLGGRGRGFRQTEARTRRYAIGIVAVAAIGLFHHGIQAFFECAVLRPQSARRESHYTKKSEQSHSLRGQGGSRLSNGPHIM